MSRQLYCLAQFLPKAGNTLREDGCISYRVTRLVNNPNADGQSFPIVFNEIWRDEAAFNAHCQRKEIVEFFAKYCEAEDGLIERWNVCVYSDEPEDYDAPVFDYPVFG